MTRSKAIRLREIIETAVENLDDAAAQEAVELFPKLDKEGKDIKKNKRYNHNGKLVRAKKDFKYQKGNQSDNADFWEDLSSKHENEKYNSEHGHKDN